MQHRPDHSTSFSVCLKHECVQVGEECIANIQHITRCFSKISIPCHWVLSLLHIKIERQREFNRLRILEFTVVMKSEIAPTNNNRHGKKGPIIMINLNNYQI